MIARVSQLYYEDKLKQAEISERLHVSQEVACSSLVAPTNCAFPLL